MLLREIRNIYRKELEAIYPREEIDAFFYLGIEALLGLEKFILVLDPDMVVDKENESGLFQLLQGLKEQVPIQYLLGQTEFLGRKFKTGPGVLVPRPETEELVHWLLESGHEASDILDIGTGSGCIAVSLGAAMQTARISALDVSDKALEYCKENAETYGVSINFIRADILSDDPDGQWDVIVSNPPYVLESEKMEMRENVLRHEPDLALFVPDEDPLRFYDRIAAYAAEHLNTGGSLYFEINEAYGSEMVKLLESHNFTSVELRKDIFDKDRFIRGYLANQSPEK